MGNHLNSISAQSEIETNISSTSDYLNKSLMIFNDFIFDIKIKSLRRNLEDAECIIEIFRETKNRFVDLNKIMQESNDESILQNDYQQSEACIETIMFILSNLDKFVIKK